MNIEDSRQLLEAVGRFSRERIAGLTARPETPVDTDQLTLLTREACALGILPTATSDDGFGLWERCETVPAMAFNTAALRRIACANPGIAFAWHRMALARSVAMQLGVALDANDLQGALLVPTGHYGLARSSLATWLRAGAMQGSDRDLLSDWLDRAANPTTLYAAKNWTNLIWPIWSEDRIAWRHVARKELDASAGNAQHGFDELGAFVVCQGPNAQSPVSMDMDRSRSVYARMLKLEMLGLLAIGAGALDRGQELARDYAVLRRQGGKAIAGHPAVQHMLSDVEITRHSVDMALAAFATPVDELDIGVIAASRASMSSALCHAANQVVQVHGGSGYLRDVGPEKLVRDQNMLKLMSGGTREIHLFLAGWTGAAV